MSEESVEIVRAMYEPFARGDFSAWADVPDDFEFVASSELPDAGTYRGEAAVRWMTTWVESFDGHMIEATVAQLTIKFTNVQPSGLTQTLTRRQVTGAWLEAEVVNVKLGSNDEHGPVHFAHVLELQGIDSLSVGDCSQGWAGVADL